MSLSAHKAYGPKGVGALVRVARTPRHPTAPAAISAAGRRRSLRSGTVATHQVVGMGAAFDLARRQLR